MVFIIKVFWLMVFSFCLFIFIVKYRVKGSIKIIGKIFNKVKVLLMLIIMFMLISIMSILFIL